MEFGHRDPAAATVDELDRARARTHRVAYSISSRGSDRLITLQIILDTICDLPDTTVWRVSSVYEADPAGLCVAVGIETSAPADALTDHAQAIREVFDPEVAGEPARGSLRIELIEGRRDLTRLPTELIVPWQELDPDGESVDPIAMSGIVRRPDIVLELPT